MSITGKAGILAAAAFFLAASPADAGDRLIGQKAAEWKVADWINSEPLSLADLKGKVVLVRWWTAPDCPFCAATAPGLNTFHEKYADRGLAVIGFYHHKGREPLELEAVRSNADRFGFRFPVAVDHDWEALKRWWLDDHERAWTSVTFLLDRDGIIRHIHPGGQYVEGDEAYTEMETKIEELLEQR